MTITVGATVGPPCAAGPTNRSIARGMSVAIALAAAVFLTPDMAQPAADDAQPQLILTRVLDLPIAPALSPGWVDPESDGPFYYGPSGLVIDEGKRVLVTEEGPVAVSVVESDWHGHRVRVYSADAKTNETIPWGPIASDGSFLLALLPPGPRLFRWRIGDQGPAVGAIDLKGALGTSVEAVYRVWPVNGGDWYFLCRAGGRERIVRVSTSGDMRLQTLPVGAESTPARLRGRVCVDPTGTVHLVTRDPRGDFWLSSSPQGKPARQLWGTPAVGSPDDRCTGLTLLGASATSALYMLAHFERRTGSGEYRGLPMRLCAMRPDHALQTLGAIPQIKRFYMRDSGFVVSKSGRIYCAYPLESKVPKGSPVHFALGRIDGYAAELSTQGAAVSRHAPGEAPGASAASPHASEESSRASGEFPGALAGSPPHTSGESPGALR